MKGRASVPVHSTTRRSELELFQALADGGEPADLAEFSSRLRRCALWVLNRKPWGHGLFGEVDEIVDDAHLRLEQLRARGFQGGAVEFKTYLYRVVVSACVEAANRRRSVESLDAPVTLSGGDEKPLGEVLREMVDPHLSSEARTEREEDRSRVRRALGTLDARCRALLERFHFADTPIKALAEQERTRTNTIEVALTRCRKRLYAAFLASYVGSADDFKQRVSAAARELPGQLARVFQAWWAENRSVVEIGRELGLTSAETKQVLAKAKFEVWRVMGGVAG